MASEYSCTNRKTSTCTSPEGTHNNNDYSNYDTTVIIPLPIVNYVLLFVCLFIALKTTLVVLVGLVLREVSLLTYIMLSIGEYFK